MSSINQQPKYANNYKRVYPSSFNTAYGNNNNGLSGPSVNGLGLRQRPSFKGATNNIPNSWAAANKPNQNQYHPGGPQTTQKTITVKAANYRTGNKPNSMIYGNLGQNNNNNLQGNQQIPNHSTTQNNIQAAKAVQNHVLNYGNNLGAQMKNLQQNIADINMRNNIPMSVGSYNKWPTGTNIKSSSSISSHSPSQLNVNSGKILTINDLKTQTNYDPVPNSIQSRNMPLFKSNSASNFNGIAYPGRSNMMSTNVQNFHTNSQPKNTSNETARIAKLMGFPWHVWAILAFLLISLILGVVFLYYRIKQRSINRNRESQKELTSSQAESDSSDESSENSSSSSTDNNSKPNTLQKGSVNNFKSKGASLISKLDPTKIITSKTKCSDRNSPTSSLSQSTLSSGLSSASESDSIFKLSASQSGSRRSSDLNNNQNDTSNTNNSNQSTDKIAEKTNTNTTSKSSHPGVNPPSIPTKQNVPRKKLCQSISNETCVIQKNSLTRAVCKSIPSEGREDSAQTAMKTRAKRGVSMPPQAPSMTGENYNVPLPVKVRSSRGGPIVPNRDSRFISDMRQDRNSRITRDGGKSTHKKSFIDRKTYLQQNSKSDPNLLNDKKNGDIRAHMNLHHNKNKFIPAVNDMSYNDVPVLLPLDHSNLNPGMKGKKPGNLLIKANPENIVYEDLNLPTPKLIQ